MLEQAARYLSVLGLQLGASLEDVQQTYRTLARQWHPDRFYGDESRTAEASERLRLLNEAVHWLRKYHEAWADQTPKSGARTSPEDTRSASTASGSTGVPARDTSNDGARQEGSPASGPSVDDTPTSQFLHIDFRALAGSVLAMLLVAYMAIAAEFGTWSPHGFVEWVNSRVSSLSVRAERARDASTNVETGVAEPRQLPAPPPLGQTEGVDLNGQPLVFVEQSRERWGSLWIIAQKATLSLGQDSRTWQRTKVVDSEGTTIVAFVGLPHTFAVHYGTSSDYTVLTIDARLERNGCCEPPEVVVPVGGPTHVLSTGRGRVDLFDEDLDGEPNEIATTLFGAEGSIAEPQLVWTTADVAIDARLVDGAIFIGPAFLTVSSPSFDCELAETWAEEAICESDALSRLDQELATQYAFTRQALDTATFEKIRLSQREWLAHREKCELLPRRLQMTCLEGVYRERIAVLRSSQHMSLP